MFYLTTHSTHFIYGYMASDIWLRTIMIVRKETRCHHIGYSFQLGTGNWETVFTCLYPFTVQTRPLAGTASGMASDSVRSRGKELLGPIWNLRPMGGRDFTEF